MSFSVQRHFTNAALSPYDAVKWRVLDVSGSKSPVEVPHGWSPTAAEIAYSKYFRHRGLGPTGSEGETSVRQLFGRVTRTLRASAINQGYLNENDATVFADELAHILLNQIASFNSPVYFNVGIFPEYGILGSAENFVWNARAGVVEQTVSAFVRPQASACFIQDCPDDLLGIFELLKSEAKLFKYGSGTGTNFSRLRAKGEQLDGSGESTGLISYLEIFDKAAQAIKSGGTTRRAAKMVVLDADHPEIMEFIQWKMLEERKARVLLANGYSGGMEGEAFRTVSGQNSNNSISLSDEFLKRAQYGGNWELTARRDGRKVRELPASKILKEMAQAAWECGDPGVHYQGNIQKWHMCPNTGPIRSSNPCSEFMFLDDSACNLASMNLVKFLRHDGTVDWDSFKQTVRILILAQEILVDYAAYPTAKIAETSHKFRPLGLGYSNLGAFFMRQGLPYDSDGAREWTTKITAAMHALALKTSAELAEQHGAFAGFEANREPALAVFARHEKAWTDRQFHDLQWVTQTFKDARAQMQKSGLRNAQVTLIAPTGTIGLLMDCDTLGIEPDFALVKRKTLAGGGELSLVNQSVWPALRRLGYDTTISAEIEEYIRRNGRIAGAPGFKKEHAAVFDCALAPEGQPERRVSVDGHLKVMAAAQPFLSGAISKTVNLPARTTVEEIEKLFCTAWTLGLKSLAIYRDGSKSLQPLCVDC